jgi:histone-lysine N-methyltransferase SETD2
VNKNRLSLPTTEKRKEKSGQRRLRQREGGQNLGSDRCSCIGKLVHYHAIRPLTLYAAVEEGSKCATTYRCSFRAAQIECRSACGSQCKNRRISRGEFTKPVTLEVRPADKKGHGLFTVQGITKGQLVIEYTGERLSPGSQLAYNEDKRYLFQHNGTLINGNKGGNNSKYLNHSCQPNLESEQWEVKGQTRIVFVATQDIENDTELTFSYNRKGSEQCYCGAINCSGTLEGWQTAEKRRSN